MLEEAHDGGPAERVGLPLQQQAAFGREAANHRPVVPREGRAEDRGLAARRVGAHDGGNHIETGFIAPDDGTPLA
jgi:hypothetical protein